MIDFDKFADKYDKLRTADLGIIQHFIDNVKLKKNSEILDFGCGTGNYLLILKNMGFRNLYGIDSSARMLEYAKNKLDAYFFLGSPQNYPWIENKFDFIYLIDVIHLIENMELLIHRLDQSLKKQGIIAIVTQSHEQINNYFFKKYFPSTVIVDIDRHPSIDTITIIFKQLGFSLKEKIYNRQDTTILIDENYLNGIKEKCFTILELIPQDEFVFGVEAFEKDLNKKKSFAVNHWGETILLFERNKVSRIDEQKKFI